MESPSSTENMRTRVVTIGLIQMQCGTVPDANLTKAIKKIDEVAKQGAQIVCLPELFMGPYFCQYKDEKQAFEWAEPIPGSTTDALSRAARKHGIVIIGGSLFEKSYEGKFYNTSPILGPDGSLLGLHRKVHIPEDPLFHEQHYFSPGNSGISVCETPFGKISTLICFDQWFPEAARIAALQEAEIIFYPTAIGMIDETVEENITGDWQKMWLNAQLGHAASNNVFIAAVNRVGKEGAISFWGGSFVADPSSELLARAGKQEEIIIAKCDLSRVKLLQDSWGFLRSRRPDTYKVLLNYKNEYQASKHPHEGFRMPAEWETHAATWLTWPHDEAHWPGKFKTIAPLWARIIKELETGEDLHILIHDDKTQNTAIKAMEQVGVVGHRIHLHRVRNNFSWARDHGPIFLKNKKGNVMISHWQYNGWGEKYAYDLDDDIPTHIAKITRLPIVDVPMVLEGGSIDVNGLGTLLTTRSCLLNPNRNPTLTKEQIEQNLKDHLGVTHILWLEGGIVGDDTDGHVDNLARFAGPRTVIAVIEENPKDENYAPLQENLKLLRKMTDQDGNPLDIIELPMPASVIYENMRLPASYANFYIGNRVVLLPTFSDPNDQRAVDTLQKVFPTRRILAIDARDLVWGLGAFHCVTQQQPDGP